MSVAKKAKTTNEDDGGFERSLYRAVRLAKWLLPTSEQEVEEEEERMAESESAALPKELSDPFAALDPSRRRRTSAAVAIPKRVGDVDDSIARAAREGDEHAAISDEVEERMRNDKERARSKSGD